ncbi:H-NS histone family protein [Achromobacter xylosoxidans]|uniref:H-NS histone family protein n=1 Tax=Alcaligenes xylosoxydans xylosoxydans TaxID=85698 RepID=UPI0009F3B2D5|nr:H-NS histone family protein [Achromobacter xylosoxidans]
MTKAIAKISAQIKKLEEQHRQLTLRRRAAEIKNIVQTMREVGLTPQDILPAFAGEQRKKKNPMQSAPRKLRGLVPPKYRHPDTGETWTGRGRAPRWLVAAESAGADRAEYRL